MWRYWPDVAVPGSPIRASQVSGLRTAIDEDIAAAALPAQSWTWTNVALGDRVLAKHFTEMRAAVQALWTHKGWGDLPGWTSGVTPGGPSVGTAATPVRASDLNDLRLWLNKYGDFGQQGVNSFSFDPNAGGALVGANWISDIVALKRVEPHLYVRCTMFAGPANAFGDTEINGYSQAFSRYLGSGLKPYAVFTRSFYNRPGFTPDPNAALDPVNFTNPYIDQFVARLKQVLPAFYDAGLRDCIIWNEPNDDGKDEFLPLVLDPAGKKADKFAALLYHSWFAIREALVPPRQPINMYWGGVVCGPPDPGDPPNRPPADPNIPDVNARDYIAAVYAALDGRAGHNTDIPWPWEGINLHIYGDRTDQNFATLFDDWVHGIKFITPNNVPVTKSIGCAPIGIGVV